MGDVSPKPRKGECAYHREVSHYSFGSTNNVTDIGALFHEANAFTPGHVTKKVPSEERDPVGNVTRLTLVRFIEEPGFELGAEGSKVLIHDTFDLEGVLQAVKLLYGLNASSMEVVAACAEDILNDLTALESIVDTGILLVPFWRRQRSPVYL